MMMEAVVPGLNPGVATNRPEDLVKRARRGDDAAFRLIFDRYGRPIVSFIYDMVGKRELAEELAQEAFVRAYKNLGSLRDESKLSTWLFGIAKNVAREALRSRKKEDYNVGIDDGPAGQVSDSGLLPDGQLLNKELNSVIHTALAALDEDKRLVFTLKIFHERSYEEIAGITGSSIPHLQTDPPRARAQVERP